MKKYLDMLARGLAYLGGLLMCALALLTLVSIVGRAGFSTPVPGDVELTQMGMAAAVACFLPWCQVRGGNIIVDFFTTKASVATQRRLDAVGTLLLAVMMGLLAWRTGLGAAGVREAGETTMIVGFPLWLTYAAIVPGVAVTAVIALAQALIKFMGDRRE